MKIFTCVEKNLLEILSRLVVTSLYTDENLSQQEVPTTGNRDVVIKEVFP